MNKKLSICIAIFIFAVSSVGMLYAEDITLLSYYPSPSGNYNNLKAKHCWIGEDSSGNLLSGGNATLQVGGVYTTTTNDCSIYANNSDGYGVFGDSPNYFGIYGVSTNSNGVVGYSLDDGVNTNIESGVMGVGKGKKYGVYGISDYIGVYAECSGAISGGYAGYFNGNVYVTGYTEMEGDLTVDRRAILGIPNIPVFSTETDRINYYSTRGMTPVEGDLIYFNDSTPSLQLYISGSWRDI